MSVMTRPLPRVGIDPGRLAELSLRVVGWSAVTLLSALGLIVVLFALFGGLTLDGFFAQIANIGARYASADADRRHGFYAVIGDACLVAAILVGFFRRASLVALFTAKERGR